MGEEANIFSDDNTVPVKVVVDGKEITVGQAKLVPGPDGIVHVDMDLKTDDPSDVIDLFGNGITGYPMKVEAEVPLSRPAHRKSEADIQRQLGLEPHEHTPRQHRDMKPPWCNECMLTADYKEPKKNFGFGTPANPLRRDGT